MNPNDIVDYTQIAITVIGIASMIATITPNKTDDKYMQMLLTFINKLAMNVGQSKNKED